MHRRKKDGTGLMTKNIQDFATKNDWFLVKKKVYAKDHYLYLFIYKIYFDNNYLLLPSPWETIYIDWFYMTNSILLFYI